jgi:DNA uptake protein ComE-like DNA-binding protein
VRQVKWSDLLIRIAATLGLCVALLWVLSCSRREESTQDLQQQAQQATVRAKIEARQAAADARVAAKQAARDTRAIAAGVREGMKTPTGGDRPVNVNSASRRQLEMLPGVDATVARHIEEHRPYAHARDLVRKGAVSEDEYQRIAADVTAG